MATAYSFSKELTETDFDAALEKVTAALAGQGFGVLTTIDVKATLKKKLDKDFRRYHILGACNPNLAYQALQAEEELGILLPCNVVVAEREAGGGLMVSVVNPRAMFQVLDEQDAIASVMEEAETRLKAAMEAM